MFRAIVVFGMFLSLFAASVVFVSAQNPLTEIVYSSFQNGRSNIYRMRADGSGKVNLTKVSTQSQDSMPSWSPDARRIVFVRGSRLGLMDFDGRNVSLVTNVVLNPKYPIFSPDGSRIIFSRGTGSSEDVQLFSINVDGTNLTQLTAGWTGNLKSSFSPDGSRLVLESDRSAQFSTSNIFTLNFSNGAVLPLIADVISFRPDWSPDGSKIAYTASNGSSLGIFGVNADGSNRYLIVGSGDGASWSPDSSRIAYASDSNGGDIYTISAAGGGTPVRLTDSPALDRYPDWSSRPVAAASVLYDFDYDGKADQAVFRPSDGIWYLNNSTSGMTAAPFGISTDKLAPADFDADGKTDLAVFRSGTWYWMNSLTNSFSAYQFGLAGDVPVPFDYTGDKRAELAVFRNGIWYQLDLSNNQFSGVQFGTTGDQPISADFDADGKMERAVFRPSNGVWYWTNSSNNQFNFYQFGQAGDKPVPADYDADGKADIVIYRDGFWYINATTLGYYIVELGAAGDTPVPADYDGDGKTEPAVFGNGIWKTRPFQQNITTVQFGTANDKPAPAAFIP